MDPNTDQFWLQSLAGAIKDAAIRARDSIARGSNLTLAAQDDFLATYAIMEQIAKRIDQNRLQAQGEERARAA